MKGLSWWGIARLGLVQLSLGSVVVLFTSTLNRVITVELALPAALPGALVAIHYVVQMLRPRFGHGSDTGGRRTPWIIGGMITLALGGFLASLATMWMAESALWGSLLAIVAFLIIGAGIGACGTSLLVLMAALVVPERRAAAATITWLMMIFGLAFTAITVGSLLDPFSLTRLLVITSVVSLIACLITVAAVWRIEPSSSTETTQSPSTSTSDQPTPSFKEAIAEVISEPQTRRFGLFVFVSMLAYSAQDLVLEPFAGAVFNLTPGESTQLGGTQHGGVFLGMILVGVIGSYFKQALRQCMIIGCLCSAILLCSLALAGQVGGDWPLSANVFALGFANGVFAVAAIGSMMHLVSNGHTGRDGVRMGVWGAAQAIAFALGGMLGTGSIDVIRWASGDVTVAYSLVFAAQATLFIVAAILAVRLSRKPDVAMQPASLTQAGAARR
ncbi:MAG: BCD family MFS transporter [Woeseiaceae bacterium]